MMAVPVFDSHVVYITAHLSNGRGDYSQRATLIGRGLNKMHKTRELEDTPSVRGMVNKISHLVEIVEERG